MKVRDSSTDKWIDTDELTLLDLWSKRHSLDKFASLEPILDKIISKLYEQQKQIHELENMVTKPPEGYLRFPSHDFHESIAKTWPNKGQEVMLWDKKHQKEVKTIWVIDPAMWNEVKRTFLKTYSHWKSI